MAITPEQRELRKKYIGSSDVPRIMTGQSFRVVLEKLGVTHESEGDDDDIDALSLDGDRERTSDDDGDPSQEDSYEIQIGQEFESAVLTAYEAKTEPKQLIRSPNTIVSDLYPWLAVHLDGLAYEPQNTGEPVVNTEAKTVGFYRRKEYGDALDDVPLRVHWQAQTQMLVAGVNETHVPACFIDAKSLKCFILEKPLPIKIYVIRADQMLQEHIIKKTREVADYIAAGVLPPPENLEDFLYLHKKDNGEAIEADQETVFKCIELSKVRTAQEQLLELRKGLEFDIKKFMDKARELWYEGSRIATWKKNADGEKLDKEKFSREQPILYKQYLKPVEGNRPFLLKDKQVLKVAGLTERPYTDKEILSIAGLDQKQIEGA